MRQSLENSGVDAVLLGQKIALPELLESHSPVPDITNRDAWEALPNDVSARLISEGETALTTPIPVLTAQHWTRYSRDGNRAEFEALYFKRRRLLNALSLAELVENTGRFIPAIVDAAFAICEESGWQLPAHNAHVRGGARAPLPDPTRPVLDLFAAETGAQIALLMRLMPDALETVAPGIVDRAHHEVKKRVTTPYLTEQIWWMGHVDGPTNNWTAWCTQNITLAAQCLPLSGTQRRSICAKALTSLDAFVSDMGDDGACPEGVFYYRHAGLCLWGALSLLDQAAPGALQPLWQHPKLRAIAEFIATMHVAGDTFLNFGDCPSVNAPCSIREALFARTIGSEMLEQFALSSLQSAGWSSQPEEINLWYRALNALHAEEAIRKTATPPDAQDIWYPSIGLMVSHDEAFTLAAKAGNNGDSHNHNDVGSVTLYKSGQPVLIDLGVETYTAKTFSDRRYEIWTMQSSWHNLPDFGGHMQAAGTEHAARDVAVSLSAESAMLEMDLAGAWPNDAGVQRCLRCVKHLKGDKIIIEDQYESFHPAELNLIFAARPEITDDGLTLPGLAQIVLTGAGAIAIETIEIHDERLLWSLPKHIYRARIAVSGPSLKLTIT